MPTEVDRYLSGVPIDMLQPNVIQSCHARCTLDDVKIGRWRKKFDQIPEDTKDPGLLKARKALKRKMPKRRAGEQYWSETQFEKLKDSPPDRLRSKGTLPWRLLAYMLQASPDVELLRTLVGKRLMDERHLESGRKALERMLLILWRAGYVELEPPRRLSWEVPR